MAASLPYPDSLLRMHPSDAHCRELASPGLFNFVLSIFILFAILASYVPQHARIISLKSSFGISPYFILLGTTSSASSFANILTLPRSARDIYCCKEINGVACFSTMLGMFQVGAQWLGFSIILLLFVIYFPRATSPTSPITSEAEPSPSPETNGPRPTYKTVLAVAALSLIYTLTLALVSFIVVLQHPASLQTWANFLGIMAAVLASIQYFPQIYTTLRLRCVGSLSIPMMCFQTPGGLVWAASLAARVGKEGWSTWGVFFLTACLQGVLLVMALYFEYFGPKMEHRHGEDQSGKIIRRGYEHEGERGREYVERENGHPSEETPLLRSP